MNTIKRRAIDGQPSRDCSPLHLPRRAKMFVLASIVVYVGVAVAILTRFPDYRLVGWILLAVSAYSAGTLCRAGD